MKKIVSKDLDFDIQLEEILSFDRGVPVDINETVKNIIWNHNSGINKRNFENESQKNMRKYKMDEWKLIKPYVKKMQHYLLLCYH